MRFGLRFSLIGMSFFFSFNKDNQFVSNTTSKENQINPGVRILKVACHVLHLDAIKLDNYRMLMEF
uniref:Uncharacterized protein n=1 Tax=Cucumis melo TaxID=3656 RepID=A0A9I9EAL1_CUCME